MSRMPSLFVAHGTPLLRDDARWVGELARWGEALPRPQGIVVVSAHWVADKVTTGLGFPADLVHDFSGLPKKYAEVTYAPPTPKALRERARALLEAAGPLADAPMRGLDSGAYVPLSAMYPAADIPVLPVAMPALEVDALLELGRTLAPLRDEGVLLVGSGSLVHNVKETSYRAGEPVPAWAKAFDTWVADVVARRDLAALRGYRKVKDARIAAPTAEHFVPVAFALGASLDAAEPVTFPITGFAYRSMSRRSVQLG